MKGLNFLEGMNLTLQKPFVIRFLIGQDKYERARNVLKDTANPT